MSYLRYLCLIAHSGVQHISWCAFILLVFDLKYLVDYVKIYGMLFVFILLY